ncbi:MAG: DsbA family protein [Anaerolineae bacterium]|nr:DsbA family protein [Anaerolineae bacterium]
MTNKVKNSEKQQTKLFVILGIVAVAVIAIGAFIALQNNSDAIALDYSTIPQGRTEDGAFILGDPEAPVTIVAFEDFLCPHCQSYQTELHEILQQYVVTGQARFEFRMLPISETSRISFGLAECSDELEPNSFWDAHDTLFRIASTTRFNNASSRDFAEQMGLTYSDVLDCLATADQYETDGALANQFDEVTGTPSVGWRLNGGPIRFDIINRRPNPAQVGTLIQLAASQSQ